jgi:hypothetical protein
MLFEGGFSFSNFLVDVLAVRARRMVLAADASHRFLIRAISYSHFNSSYQCDSFTRWKCRGILSFGVC